MAVERRWGGWDQGMGVASGRGSGCDVVEGGGGATDTILHIYNQRYCMIPLGGPLGSLASASSAVGDREKERGM
jgi:hypothetical protein